MSEDLPEQLQQDLSKLRELLDLSRDKFSQVNPTKFNDDKKLILLYMFWGIIYKYTESVYKLCLDKQFEAASVIVRSIYEGSVYVSYILLDETDERALEFLNESIFRSKERIERILSFNSKYPKHDGYLNSPEAIKKLLEESQERDTLIKSLGGAKKRLPKLFDASVQVDKDKEQRKIDSSHNAEYAYLSVYAHLAHYAHLTPNGLDYFLDEGPEGLKFILGPNLSDAPAIVLQPYWTLQNIMGEASKYFGIPKEEELKPFNDYFKEAEKRILKFSD